MPLWIVSPRERAFRNTTYTVITAQNQRCGDIAMPPAIARAEASVTRNAIRQANGPGGGFTPGSAGALGTALARPRADAARMMSASAAATAVWGELVFGPRKWWRDQRPRRSRRSCACKPRGLAAAGLPGHGLQRSSGQAGGAEFQVHQVQAQAVHCRPGPAWPTGRPRPTRPRSGGPGCGVVVARSPVGRRPGHPHPAAPTPPAPCTACTVRRKVFAGTQGHYDETRYP